MRWVKIHDDELQQSQPRSKKAPARRREGSPRATPNPHREARFAGRYTACAVEKDGQGDKLLRAERARYLRGCKRSDPQYKYRSARKARTINYRDPMVQSTCMPSFGAQHLHARVSAERSANKNIDLRCRAHIQIRADNAESPCRARAADRRKMQLPCPCLT